MTSRQMTMTREELLECAALDAFGLLDEYDADRYNRSFNDTTPTVQEEIRRLQADLATDGSLITTIDDEPPAALRQRVLAAVAAAIEREEAQLAPLATIGRGRHGEIDFQPRRFRFASAGMFWRAACFVLLGAVIVMAFYWTSAVRQNQNMLQTLTNLGVEDRLRELMGSEFTDLIKTGDTNKMRAVALKQGLSAAQATLYIKEDDATGFVLATGLPATTPEHPYTLRVKLDDGWKDVKTFISNGLVAGVRLDSLSSAMIASVAWQIVDATGKEVLRA
jgi:hypothetical protein